MTEVKPSQDRSSTSTPGGTRIIAFASGKGGTGQSMICANLAVYLAQIGKNILLVDGVRFGHNLHTFLGMAAPDHSVDDHYDGEIEEFEDLFHETPFKQLRLLRGLQEQIRGHFQQPDLYEDIRRSGYHYAIVDLGNYLTLSQLDYFLAADHSVLVTVPEPTAIENTYDILKSIYYRLFRFMENQEEAEQLVSKVMAESQALGVKTPRDLVRVILMFNPEIGEHFEDAVKGFKPWLLLNQVRARMESDIGPGMVSVIRRYFGLGMQYMGHVEFDGAVTASVRQRRPLLLTSPDSRATDDIELMARKILSFEHSSRRG